MQQARQRRTNAHDERKASANSRLLYYPSCAIYEYMKYTTTSGRLPHKTNAHNERRASANSRLLYYPSCTKQNAHDERKATQKPKQMPTTSYAKQMATTSGRLPPIHVYSTIRAGCHLFQYTAHDELRKTNAHDELHKINAHDERKASANSRLLDFSYQDQRHVTGCLPIPQRYEPALHVLEN